MGGFDFAAVVLDGVTGDELFRWQNGTVGDDVIDFAQFDSVGGLYFGGLSSAAWVGGAGDEDVIALKFEPLSTSVSLTEAPTSSPTAAATVSPSPPPTPGPTVFSTPAPSAASRDIPSVPSPAPTAPPTSAMAVAEGEIDNTSSAGLEQWKVGAIVAGAAAGGVFLAVLALLCEFALGPFGGDLVYIHIYAVRKYILYSHVYLQFESNRGRVVVLLKCYLCTALPLATVSFPAIDRPNLHISQVVLLVTTVQKQMPGRYTGGRTAPSTLCGFRTFALSLTPSPVYVPVLTSQHHSAVTTYIDTNDLGM